MRHTSSSRPSSWSTSGQLVDVAGVGGVDDGALVDVAQVGDLALERRREGPLAAAHDDVGLDAPAAQLGDRVLRGLGLLLARRADERHQRDVDVADVLPADLLAELPDGLQEGQDLDVADGAADLGDHDVDVVGGEPADAALDLVGDVRDDLHGAAEVVAAALGGQHRLVDRAGRGVGRPRQVLVDEALVVAEVEVGLAAVVGDEHLAVLERVHRARVDVDVRVELLHRDPEAPRLQEPAERGGREPLAEGAGHATGHEDVLGRNSARQVAPVEASKPASGSHSRDSARRWRSVAPGWRDRVSDAGGRGGRTSAAAGCASITRGEAHPLAGQVEHAPARPAPPARAGWPRASTTPRPTAAPSALAPVSPSMARSRRSGPSSAAPAPTASAGPASSRPARRVAGGEHGEGDERDLDGAARAPGRAGWPGWRPGRRAAASTSSQPACGRRGTALTTATATSAPPTSFSMPVVSWPARSAAACPAKPRRWPEPARSSNRPSSPNPSTATSTRLREVVATGSSVQREGVEEPADGDDGDVADDGDDTDPGRDGFASVVGPQQGRVGEGGPQRPPAGRQPRSRRPRASRARSRLDGSSSKATSTNHGTSTASIMPGTTMPESLTPKPRTAPTIAAD